MKKEKTDEAYYSLFIDKKDEKSIKRVAVIKKRIEEIFESYSRCTSDRIVMCFGVGGDGIYDRSSMVKVSFDKRDYNSLEMVLNDEDLGIINDEKDKEDLFNKCARVWNLPLPFPGRKDF